MKKTYKLVFYAVMIILIFSQGEIKAEETNERYYSKTYIVISANVGNSDPRDSKRGYKLQPGSDEEKRVISGIQDIKPDILILIEAFNKQQVESICFDFKNREQIYSIHGGPHDFICVKNEIGDVINHEQMPSGSNASVGYVDVVFKKEEGRKARLFYAHFISPGIHLSPPAPGLGFSPEENAAHINAFTWIEGMIIKASRDKIPCLMGGDLNNDFIRERDDKSFYSGKYIYEQVAKHNLWIFNTPIHILPSEQLPDGSAECDYEATYRIKELTIDWVIGKQAIPPFKAPEFQLEIDPIGGGLNRLDFHFITSPPDWWQDTGVKDHSRFNFDHKPLYGKVVFWWKEKIQPPPETGGTEKILFVGHEQQDTPLDLWAINPDGSGMVKILSGVLPGYASLSQVALSPDGKELAVVSIRDVVVPGNFARTEAEIKIMGLDGRLKRVLGLKGLPKPYLLNPPENLRWSQDDAKIVFTSGNDIYVISIDGVRLVRLTNEGNSYYPNWWPDGRIVFENHNDEEGWLRLIDADGKSRAQSVNLLPKISHLEFSQDGRNIAFSGDNPLCSGKFIDGKITETKTLVNSTDQWRAFDKRWSPDGSKIAFFDPFKSALVVIDADGSNLRPIIGGFIGLVCWTKISDD